MIQACVPTEHVFFIIINLFLLHPELHTLLNIHFPLSVGEEIPPGYK